MRQVDNTWRTGRAECLYFIANYALELAKQYKFECEKERETKITSDKKHFIKIQLDTVDLIQSNLKTMKPGSFLNNEYVPFVESLDKLKFSQGE